MLAVIQPVVDAAFVAAHPDAVLADVRWYLDGRSGRDAYEQGHLPGAVFVDLDRHLAASDRPATEGRHPLPTPEAFASAMGAMGIADGSIVVAYDDTGGLTAGRLVTMLRMLGRDAALLDGGLMGWDGPIEQGPGPSPVAAPFTPVPWPEHRLATADDVAVVAAAGGVVLDARVHERFTGESAMIDPRPGHVPGARNAPWNAVLDADGHLLPPEQLRAHFAALGVTSAESDEAVTYCGSGVSACLNLIAMEHAGLAPARLYVASWSGWSADPARQAALGD
jgi:thiosulfate/3-mercaptopyruvate sulfurtransferase